jgi:hypothetical protein
VQIVDLPPGAVDYFCEHAKKPPTLFCARQSTRDHRKRHQSQIDIVDHWTNEHNFLFQATGPLLVLYMQLPSRIWPLVPSRPARTYLLGEFIDPGSKQYSQPLLLEWTARLSGALQ